MPQSDSSFVERMIGLCDLLLDLSCVAAGKSGASRTEERILASALHLFAQNGYLQTSFQDITAQAGTPPSAIYHCFGDKEQLFEEVLRKAINGLLASFRALTAILFDNRAEVRADLEEKFGQWYASLPEDPMRIFLYALHCENEKCRRMVWSYVEETLRLLERDAERAKDKDASSLKPGWRKSDG